MVKGSEGLGEILHRRKYQITYLKGKASRPGAQNMSALWLDRDEICLARGDFVHLSKSSILHALHSCISGSYPIPGALVTLPRLHGLYIMNFSCAANMCLPDTIILWITHRGLWSVL